MLVYSPLLEWITHIRLFYRANGLGNNSWYEAAIVLYKGTPPAAGTLPATWTLGIADVRVVRGESIADLKTESFEVPANGDYFVAFYAGSYKRRGNSNFGASLTVSEVRVPSVMDSNNCC